MPSTFDFSRGFWNAYVDVSQLIWHFFLPRLVTMWSLFAQRSVGSGKCYWAHRVPHRWNKVKSLILMVVIQFGIIFIFLMPIMLLLVAIQIGIVLMLNLISYLIHDQTEESPLVAFYQSLGYQRWIGVSVLTFRQFNDYEA